MKKDDDVFLGHMLDQARLAIAKTAHVDRAAYDADENLRLALAHLIQTIGEAARRVSGDLQQQHSAIPWSAIIGIRHKIVHDYLHVDYDIIWDVTTADLPPLVAQLEALLPGE